MLALNLWLGGRSYRIRVPADREAAVRAAVKTADAKVADLRRQYAGRDDQDFVAMTLLLYAAEGAGTVPGTDAALLDLVQRIDTVLGKG